jgi:hypothetical protein
MPFTPATFWPQSAIAADTALVPFLVAFGALAPIGEALATTGYDLFGASFRKGSCAVGAGCFLQ